jgi:hypothetical protein
MDSQELGKRLVSLCQKGKNMEAIETLYSPEIVSIEPFAMPGSKSPETHGIEAVKGKTKWWGENHEVHSASVTGPFPHGDRFAVVFNYDITPKTTKKRMKMEEVALYTVRKDKIVREEFFYTGQS